MSMRALRRLTEDVDEQHREAMRTIDRDLADTYIAGADKAPQAGRRSFLRNMTLGGAAVAIGAAVAPALGVASPAVAQTATTVGPSLDAADQTLVRFVHGLELALTASYDAMIATGRLHGGPLGSARTFSGHHTDHAAALMNLLPAPAGPPTATTVAPLPNPKIMGLFSPRISAAADNNALMQVAFDIESAVAATYQATMAALGNWEAASAAAGIEGVEAQHAVVWAQALNLPIDQWMPSLQDTRAALDPSKYAAR